MKPPRRLNSLASIETKLARCPVQRYHLRLYVTGVTPRSLRAIENIKSLCETYLRGRYELSVVDVYQQPHLAKEQQILAAPTLIKLLPKPLRRFIGDMSNKERILLGLEIQDSPGKA